MNATLYSYRGKPADLIVIHDISRLKKSLKEVQSSEEKYRNFFITSRDCVFFTSRDGKWLDMSDSAPGFFGYSSKEELFKIDIPNLYVEPEERLNDLDIIVNKGFSKDMPLQLRKKDGSIMDTLISSVAIKDENSNIHAFQGIIRDITQQKKDEKALKESKKDLEEMNESKDKFFSLISHDLRTPFNAIIGFSELLWKEDMNISEVKSIAKDLYKTGKETYELLNNLLEWSRSETGRIKYYPSNIRLETLAERTVALLSESATWKDIGIYVDIDGELKVHTDENMLLSTIRNLVSNAIKFTPKGGRVKIYASKNNDTVNITIEDNGTGIKSETLKKLFVLNKESITKGTEGELGSGLGLILCKEFAEKSGGKISVRSKPGEGSSFTVSLPGLR